MIIHISKLISSDLMFRHTANNLFEYINKTDDLKINIKKYNGARVYVDNVPLGIVRLKDGKIAYVELFRDRVLSKSEFDRLKKFIK